MHRSARYLAVLLLLSAPFGGAAAAHARMGAEACRANDAAPEARRDAPFLGAALAAGPAQDGSLALSDGRRLVPAGVILPTSLHPDADVPARSAATVAAVLDGRFLRLGAETVDRHGRVVGAAWLSDDASDAKGTALALALIEAGAGYADPRGAPACASRLLAAEDDARRNSRGIFATDHAIVSTNDEAAAGMRGGLFTLAEGRVKAAGATREKVYLNFGPRWRDDFTVILLAKDFATILGNELDVAMLRGARVRVRGVVREDGGPAILVRSPSEISVLIGPRAAEAGKGEDR